MDTLLVEGYGDPINRFIYNYHSIPAPAALNHVPGAYSHTTHDLDVVLSNGSQSYLPPTAAAAAAADLSPCLGDGSPSLGDTSEVCDNYNAVLGFISQMLMEEEDLENKPCMFHECSALQAQEKSFYDVIGEDYPGCNSSPDDDFTRICSSGSSSSSTIVNNSIDPIPIYSVSEFEPLLEQSYTVDNTYYPYLQSIPSSGNFYGVTDGPLDSASSLIQVLGSSTETELVSQYKVEQVGATQFVPGDHYPPSNYPNFGVQLKEETSNGMEERGHSPNGSEKKIHYREDSDLISQDGRSNKQLATYFETSDQSEILYDKVLLCPHMNPHLHDELPSCPCHKSPPPHTKFQQNPQQKGRPRGKKQGNKKEVVDLRSILSQCAQAVASSNLRSADELLKRIRQHSSAHGDDTERLAHYFANGLEARLAGTGTALYSASIKVTAADIIKAYQVYVKSCPFHKMSNIFANKSISKLAEGATKLHIIDFGIFYGFQWPCFLQALSMRPGGPPTLRITGIDLPQPGFRPAERVAETGRRLEKYCARFNIPFEFNAIAKKWETIQVEDLKIDRDELLVVNSLYRLRNVPDETVVVSSPRDTVLKLIRKIRPDMFIHGALNGTFNAPFFLTRFREAMFHFSTLFDMFAATAPREDENRRLFEQEVFGRDAMNVIACEGTGRIERPETYKQWQVRCTRAGFKQLPMHGDIVKEVRDKVRSHYHRDFVVDEDSNWMLQGWKGRVLYALSCWKPAHD